MESDVFPSDRYAVESYLRHLSIDPAKAIVYVSPRKGEYCLREEDIINEINKHNSGLSLIMLGNTNYYTGQFFDMKSIVKKGHEYDCIVGFDCAHGAGNIPLDLHDAGVDWATWCTYKYLNSSPGNLGGVFIHEKHHQSGLNRLAGWWGQDRTRRFQMREGFQPEIGAEGWQISNPPVIGLAAIETALELHHRAGMDRLREKSLELTGFLEYLIAELNHPRLKIITPLEPGQRGAQLSLLVQQGSAELFQRIMDAGVIADWREPDVIRIAPAPIYNSFKDVYLCVGILANALSE